MRTISGEFYFVSSDDSGSCVILVPSIHCLSCVEFIQSTLSPLPLSDLTVDHVRRSLSYSFDKETDPCENESLLHTVERLLDDAGYAVERNHVHRPSFLSRIRASIFPGQERRKHRRHLSHCTACQVEEGNEKGQGSSLQAIEIHQPGGKGDIRETSLSIEGMTCRYASG